MVLKCFMWAFTRCRFHWPTPRRLRYFSITKFDFFWFLGCQLLCEDSKIEKFYFDNPMPRPVCCWAGVPIPTLFPMLCPTNMSKTVSHESSGGKSYASDKSGPCKNQKKLGERIIILRARANNYVASCCVKIR